MKTEYSFSGGKVVRVSAKKWDVYAPDGRFLERFSTLRRASRKAEHWDKWDALDSVALMIPCSSTVILNSVLSGERIDEEELKSALVVDTLLMLLMRLSEEEREKLLIKLGEKGVMKGILAKLKTGDQKDGGR